MDLVNKYHCADVNLIYQLDVLLRVHCWNIIFAILNNVRIQISQKQSVLKREIFHLLEQNDYDDEMEDKFDNINRHKYRFHAALSKIHLVVIFIELST